MLGSSFKWPGYFGWSYFYQFERDFGSIANKFFNVVTQLYEWKFLWESLSICRKVLMIFKGLISYVTNNRWYVRNDIWVDVLFVEGLAEVEWFRWFYGSTSLWWYWENMISNWSVLGRFRKYEYKIMKNSYCGRTRIYTLKANKYYAK